MRFFLFALLVVACKTHAAAGRACKVDADCQTPATCVAATCQTPASWDAGLWDRAPWRQ